MQLRIPNAEVMEIYKTVVSSWFEDTVEKGRYDQLLHSLIAGDVATFSAIAAAAAAVLQQIEDQQYDLELRDQGVNRILHLGMAFQGKSVVIVSRFA